MPIIRPGDAGDLAQIAAIQDASPEAPRWNAADYLKCDLLVAVCQKVAVCANVAVCENVAAGGENRVVGFLASRTLVKGEREILNLAVAPEFRRQGIARHLWEAFFEACPDTVFLEVRESNAAARSLYLSLGFQELGRRRGYYETPLEAAIVMKFHSC
jgi:ribosomal-protein-alanine N-acetyltransferase